MKLLSSQWNWLEIRACLTIHGGAVPRNEGKVEIGIPKNGDASFKVKIRWNQMWDL